MHVETYGWSQTMPYYTQCRCHGRHGQALFFTHFLVFYLALLTDMYNTFDRLHLEWHSDYSHDGTMD